MRRRKWPIYNMDVGQSFRVTEREVNSLRACVQYAQTAYQLRFTTRREADGHYRCWRVE
jgi:hypothetical protein